LYLNNIPPLQTFEELEEKEKEREKEVEVEVEVEVGRRAAALIIGCQSFFFFLHRFQNISELQ